MCEVGTLAGTQSASDFSVGPSKRRLQLVRQPRLWKSVGVISLAAVDVRRPYTVLPEGFTFGRLRDETGHRVLEVETMSNHDPTVVTAPHKIIKGAELLRVARLIDAFLRVADIDPTVGLNAALFLFATGLLKTGHSEQDGHDALDRCYRIWDAEKPS
jgi:hypothetical protein